MLYLNLSQGTGYPEDFYGFAQFFQANAGVVP
jgi:hypothetical protein